MSEMPLVRQDATVQMACHSFVEQAKGARMAMGDLTGTVTGDILVLIAFTAYWVWLILEGLRS